MSCHKKHSCTLPDVDCDPPVLESYFQISQISLQIFDQKCQLLGHYYLSSIVSILGQFYVTERHGNVIHIQTEEHWRDYYPLY